MRVLFADKIHSSAQMRLASNGIECLVQANLKDETLSAALREVQPDVLVVRSTKVRAEHVMAAPSLGLVIRAGAGVNTIDVESCAKRAVFVSNCPGRNSVAVAELTMGLLVALDRFIPDNISDTRGGVWNKGTYSKARGLHGRCLGIMGMGSIGREVAVRALAFGMKVVAWCPFLSDEEAKKLGVTRLETPAELARISDVVTLHLALVPETRGIAGEMLFGEMRYGSMLINTARAELIDDDALLAAMDKKGIRAALDVFAGEPAENEGVISDRVAAHPNVYGTHHIGASTEQAQESVAAEVCRIIEGFATTGRVENCVNLAKDTEANAVVTVRHLDRVGVLAGVFEVLRSRGVNVQEMENTMLEGDEAAVARIHVLGDVGEDTRAQLCAVENVIDVRTNELKGREKR